MWNAILAAALATSATDVRVVVDMDAGTPGIQSHVVIPANQTRVEGIAVYAHDLTGGHTLWGIGYIGGLDRGIAFGHTPSNLNKGTVVAFVPTAGATLNPGNAAELLTPAHQPGFDGPEVQYLEFGAQEPSPLPATLDQPIFTVDVELASARPGDVFDFFLLDMVTVWSGGTHGAFSTTAPLALDTGGDAVLDHTRTAYGVDPDTALAVPPGAFHVDYVDGENATGAATIKVVASTGVADPASTLGRTRIRDVRPAPFTASTTVRFDLAAASAVRLTVHDMAGRRVRGLLDSTTPLTPGPRDVTWDGRDDGGRPAPPGVYVFLLDAGAARSMVRVVRLK